MELISPTVNIDFIRYAKRAATVSLVLILAGLVSIWYRGGLSYGVDFAGGTVVQLKFTQPTLIADLRTHRLDFPDLKCLRAESVGKSLPDLLG